MVISIPSDVAFTTDNAASYFPELADRLGKVTIKSYYGNSGSLPRRMWNRVRRKLSRGRHPAHSTTPTRDEISHAELTAYALASTSSHHPWSAWIDQWTRDDPYQTLVDQWCDSKKVGAQQAAIDEAVSALCDVAPSIPPTKVGAALGMRLDELADYARRYGDVEHGIPTSLQMHATLSSRTVGLSDEVTAVLPLHDMINHSSEPNLAMGFALDETFKLFATRDISEGEELFIEYKDVMDEMGEWDEDKAAWLLVHWGIPSSPPEQKVVFSPSRKVQGSALKSVGR